jgi:hypothetical protein
MQVALEGDLTVTECGEVKECNLLFIKMIDNELIERLYKRYIKQEDLRATLEALEKSLKLMSIKSEKLLLNKIIKFIEKQVWFSDKALEENEKYIPTRIILFHSPYRYLQIPLEDYDNLEGDPLWTRPTYMLEKYYPKEKQEKDKKILEQMKEDHPDWF